MSKLHKKNFEHAHMMNGRNSILTRLFNTFGFFPSLWSLVISDQHVEKTLSGTFSGPSYYLQRLLQKCLWFWPRLIDVRLWVEGGEGHIRTPDNFITFDQSSKALCDAVALFAENYDSKILDLGCNVGRHLDNLAERGYKNLHGVDAMSAALEKMQRVFPSTHSKVTLKHDLFQSYLLGCDDKIFDVVYTHGATIELVHPSFDIVRELCRVTENYVVFIVSEMTLNGYPRFWNYEFERNGFHLRAALRPIGAYPNVKNTVPSQGSDMSLLIYQRHAK